MLRCQPSMSQLARPLHFGFERVFELLTVFVAVLLLLLMVVLLLVVVVLLLQLVQRIL